MNLAKIARTVCTHSSSRHIESTKKPAIYANINCRLYTLIKLLSS
ncbi:hypothetical protein VCHA50O396_360065 [Vibrio chagasii]|nr:hypothetical protein VCHA50O396_360065 [Vibrio chagasii]